MYKTTFFLILLIISINCFAEPQNNASDSAIPPNDFRHIFSKIKKFDYDNDNSKDIAVFPSEFFFGVAQRQLMLKTI